jgi:hypothetical protein
MRHRNRTAMTKSLAALAFCATFVVGACIKQAKASSLSHDYEVCYKIEKVERASLFRPGVRRLVVVSPSTAQKDTIEWKGEPVARAGEQYWIGFNGSTGAVTGLTPEKKACPTRRSN